MLVNSVDRAEMVHSQISELLAELSSIQLGTLYSIY